MCQFIGCSNNCLNEGICDKSKGVCECKSGYVGDYCEILLEENNKHAQNNCADNCSEHGICINQTTCICDIRYEGAYCEYPISNIELIKCRADCYNKCWITDSNKNIRTQLNCIDNCLNLNCSEEMIYKNQNKINLNCNNESKPMENHINETKSQLNMSIQTENKTEENINYIDFYAEN